MRKIPTGSDGQSFGSRPLWFIVQSVASSLPLKLKRTMWLSSFLLELSMPSHARLALPWKVHRGGSHPALVDGGLEKNRSSGLLHLCSSTFWKLLDLKSVYFRNLRRWSRSSVCYRTYAVRNCWTFFLAGSSFLSGTHTMMQGNLAASVTTFQKAVEF